MPKKPVTTYYKDQIQRKDYPTDPVDLGHDFGALFIPTQVIHATYNNTNGDPDQYASNR